jgi:hypothetical protein
MKTWFRWILLALTIGGGFTGLVVTVQAMFQSEGASFFQFLLFGGFAALYLFTVVSGLLFADNPKCTIPLMIVLILQIPWISSPILTYTFCAGFRITAGLVSGRFAASWRFGSDWQVFILQGQPWGAGINLFAALVLVLLLRFTRTPDAVPGPTE